MLKWRTNQQIAAYLHIQRVIKKNASFHLVMSLSDAALFLVF